MRKNIEAIPAAATKALATWDWPGNFRELENLIERAVILWRGKSLEVPLAELRKLVINESANHNTQRGAEDSTRIVRETIGALNHRSLPRASAGPDNGRHDEIVRVLRESNGRVGGHRRGCRTHGYQAHDAFVADKKVRHRSKAISATSATKVLLGGFCARRNTSSLTFQQRRQEL
jgi:transcriptional regulator with GAF, ATPase, and Fis domain